VTENAQQEAIRFLRGLDGATHETISTHISYVILTATRAYKLKRAVVLPYLDFSTPQKRLAMCEREFALNSRTSPNLYLGVRRIRREAGGELVFDGVGELVDAIVEMRRFDEDALFDRLALAGGLTVPMVETLAARIAAFHDIAPIDQVRGGFAAMSGLLTLSADSPLAKANMVAEQALAGLAEELDQAALRHRTLLDRRRDSGKVRRCHGDLTLRNICLFEGEPTPFDCLEFSDDLATIDVLYDLGFLLMDLWQRKQFGLANLALNRYLYHRDESDGLPLLPYFMSLRAIIRAEIAATRILQNGDARADDEKEARAYFDLAQSLLQPGSTRVIAIGGLSGSGKSSVAARFAPQIAPPPGARTVNSDRIRKKLFGVAPTERLPQTAYAPEVSEQVYKSLFEEAGRFATVGWSIIVDAVFDRPEDRATIEEAARDAGVDFHGIWLDADAERLAARIESRRNDVSDATRDVLSAQLRRDPGDIDWRRIDASRDLDVVVAEVAALTKTKE
jgi:aminoglycoside phosphotransferase family enzyme/predicted kinase